MELTTVFFVLSGIALLLSIIAIVLASKGAKKGVENVSASTTALQLQAYERLVLLCDRIAIPNLVSRTSDPQMSAREMQAVLVNNIKQEFDYNTSQQIYVSAVAWNAVQNLRDQSLLTINQISNVLPPDAKGVDLNKQLLAVLLAQKEKALHSLVMETLNSEAKKLMKQ